MPEPLERSADSASITPERSRACGRSSRRRWNGPRPNGGRSWQPRAPATWTCCEKSSGCWPPTVNRIRLLDEPSTARRARRKRADSPPARCWPDATAFSACSAEAAWARCTSAHDLILNQTVALKFLAPAHISEAALVRFRNEVRIARQVSHPNVCRVYDLGMVEGLHFLSMEYIDGEDLASLLRRIGRLPQDKAIEFTRKICAGLGAAHERGVLHRDLKPANIMIDGRGQVRITDFGLAGTRRRDPAERSPQRHAGLHVAGAEGGQGSHHAQRHLLARPGAARDVHRQEPQDDTQTQSDGAREGPRSGHRAADSALPRRGSQAPPGLGARRRHGAAGSRPDRRGPGRRRNAVARNGRRVARERGIQPAYGGAAVFWAWCSRCSSGCGCRKHQLPGARAAARYRPMRSRTVPNSCSRPSATPKSRDHGTTNSSAAINRPSRRSTAIPRRAATEILASHRPAIRSFQYHQHRIANRCRGISSGSAHWHRSEPGMIFARLDALGRLLRLEVRPWAIPAATSTVDWAALFSGRRSRPRSFRGSGPREHPADVVRRTLRLDRDLCGQPDGAGPRGGGVSGRAGRCSSKFSRFPSHRRGVGIESSSRRGDLGLMLVPLIVGGVMAWSNLRQGRTDRRGAAVMAGTAFTLAAGSWALSAGHVASTFEGTC